MINFKTFEELKEQHNLSRIAVYKILAASKMQSRSIDGLKYWDGAIFENYINDQPSQVKEIRKDKEVRW